MNNILLKDQIDMVTQKREPEGPRFLSSSAWNHPRFGWRPPSNQHLEMFISAVILRAYWWIHPNTPIELQVLSTTSFINNNNTSSSSNSIIIIILILILILILSLSLSLSFSPFSSQIPSWLNSKIMQQLATLWDLQKNQIPYHRWCKVYRIQLIVCGWITCG